MHLALATKKTAGTPHRAQEQKIQELEDKLVQKDLVLAEAVEAMLIAKKLTEASPVATQYFFVKARLIIEGFSVV